MCGAAASAGYRCCWCIIVDYVSHRYKKAIYPLSFEPFSQFRSVCHLWNLTEDLYSISIELNVGRKTHTYTHICRHTGREKQPQTGEKKEENSLILPSIGSCLFSRCFFFCSFVCFCLDHFFTKCSQLDKAN